MNTNWIFFFFHNIESQGHWAIYYFKGLKWSSVLAPKYCELKYKMLKTIFTSIFPKNFWLQIIFLYAMKCVQLNKWMSLCWNGFFRWKKKKKFKKKSFRMNHWLINIIIILLYCLSFDKFDNILDNNKLDNIYTDHSNKVIYTLSIYLISLVMKAQKEQ